MTQRQQSWQGRVGLRLTAAILVVACGLGIATSLADDGGDASQVTAWIEQLADPQYAVRMEAQRQLEARGMQVVDALQAAQTHPNGQIAKMAKYLLQSNNALWYSSTDSPEVRKMLQSFGGDSLAEQATRVSQLAQLKDDAGVAALSRIARYAYRGDIARRAAVTLMQLPEDDLPAQTLRRRWETVNETIGQRDNSPCRWLRAVASAYAAATQHPDPPPLDLHTLAPELHFLKVFSDIEFRRAPASMLHWPRSPARFAAGMFEPDQWQTFLTTELELLEEEKDETSAAVVSELHKLALEYLVRSGNRHAALALRQWWDERSSSLQQPIVLDPREHLADITMLLDLGLPEAAIRTADRHLTEDDDPFALQQFSYEFLAECLLAEGYVWIGQKDKALEILQAVDGENLPEDFDFSGRLAISLSARGLYDLADSLYRQSLEEIKEINVEYVRVAASYYHFLSDGRDFVAAADVLGKVVEAIDKTPELARKLEEEYLGDIDAIIRSPYYHCRGKILLTNGDIEEAKASFRKGLEVSMDNVDIVIDMQKIEGDQAWQAELDKLTELVIKNAWSDVQEAQDDMQRLQINRFGDRNTEYANALNTYAWLMACLGREVDQALRLSQLSNRLRPDSSAFVDTLAKCYAVNGDMAAAERTQFAAWTIDPGQRQLLRTLLEYQQELSPP